jgi:hypothetical protein
VARTLCRCRASQRARLHAYTAGNLKIACYVLKFPSAFPSELLGHGRECDGFWKPKSYSLSPALKAL